MNDNGEQTCEHLWGVGKALLRGKCIALMVHTGNPGDITGSVPNHCNKEDIAINWVTGTFWFPSTCKLCLHCT